MEWNKSVQIESISNKQTSLHSPSKEVSESTTSAIFDEERIRKQLKSLELEVDETMLRFESLFSPKSYLKIRFLFLQFFYCPTVV